jgi:hypothetical protein
VSEESNNEAVAALTGLPVEDILEAQWRNQSFRPCHYVAIDRAAGCVVISIRGSLEIGDLLSDLSAHPMECSMGGVDGWYVGVSLLSFIAVLREFTGFFFVQPGIN